MDYEDPIDRPDDLRSTDRALVVALSRHQGDSTPLSSDQERLLDSWVDGRLSSIDADRAAELAKHNVFAAERVLECRLFSAANEGPAVPATLAARVLKNSPPAETETGKIFNLRRPTFSGWQWSGLGAFAAAAAAIAVFGFPFWQQPSRVASNDTSQSADIGGRTSTLSKSVPPAGTTNPSPGAVLGGSPLEPSPATPNKPQQWRDQNIGKQDRSVVLRPEQSFQIAMVTLEDRSVLAEGLRRTRGMQPQVPGVEPHQGALLIESYVAVRPNSKAPSGEEPVKSRFRDINIPTALLQRAITSASNNKGAAEHSELVNFLHAQNDTYNNRARILIDSALADSLSKKFQHDSTEVRVYDLDDLRAANIRSKINPPAEDGHFLFLTIK